MTANVSMTSATSTNAIILPLSAIYQTGDTAQVWLVEDNHVALKNVEVVAFDDNSVQVRGLNAGDTVVVAGVQMMSVKLERGALSLSRSQRACRANFAATSFGLFALR